MDGSEELFLVHVSDLHIENAKSDACMRVREIAPALTSIRQNSISDVVVLVSGDVAYGGKAAEYGDALNEFDALATELRARGFRHVAIYATPGNHDCDFSTLDEGLRGALLKSISDKQTVSLGMLETLLTTQREFGTFRDAVCESSKSLGGVVQAAEFSAVGRTFCLLMVNTAWTSKLKEIPATLLMPESVLPEVTSEAELCIAILHHPLNWFAPEDAVRPVPEWLDRHVDIAFWGHEHRLDDFEQSRKRLGSSVHHYIALALDDPKNPCGFRALRFCRDGREVALHEFIWKQPGVYRVEVRQKLPSRQIWREP